MTTAQLVRDGVLRDAGPGRRDAFLPSTTVQVHAANLMTLPDGRLGCAWFGGTQEGVPDISIWFSRLVDDTWTPAEQLSDDGARSEQNPVLFPAPDGSDRAPGLRRGALPGIAGLRCDLG